MAPLSSSTFRGETKRPVFSGTTISGIPPPLAATTGLAMAMASMVTQPKASQYEGTASKSRAAITWGISFRCPAKMTRPSRPRRVLRPLMYRSKADSPRL
jgi:hypothetical protein